ncbi:hypothetical protein ILYODFUR_038646 [Ilyodon furcidens]|uniref:Uncharacterized protein n=1 Tax=Ilyodon furcidens TaxID=33524 RepID=A0ABV0U5I7_9TELE
MFILDCGSRRRRCECHAEIHGPRFTCNRRRRLPLLRDRVVRAADSAETPRRPAPQTPPPAPPGGAQGVPRPAERHSPSSVSWAIPWASSRWDVPGTPPEEGVQEASGIDARATSTGSSRCGGADAPPHPHQSLTQGQMHQGLIQGQMHQSPMPGPSICGLCLGPSLRHSSGFAADLQGTGFHVADRLTPRFVGLPGISAASLRAAYILATGCCTADLLDACISVAADLLDACIGLFAGFFDAGLQIIGFFAGFFAAVLLTNSSFIVGLCFSPGWILFFLFGLVPSFRGPPPPTLVGVLMCFGLCVL